MKRFLLVLAAVAPLGTGACNKPTPEDCRKAIANMEQLLGTETAARNTDIEAEVRRCRGGSTKESVACAIKATTPEDLNACGFRGAKAKKAGQGTVAPAPGSAAPSAPPASAPAPGSAAPSAPPASAPAPGSAAPSTTPDTPSK